MSAEEKPLGVALVICEKVITEQGTLNKTLVSTFNSVAAPSYPSIQPKLAIFVALTNSSGQKRVELIFSKDGKQLIKVGGTVSFPQPNVTIELIFNMNNLVLPEAGQYAFEVFVDSEFIFESKFNAEQR